MNQTRKLSIAEITEADNRLLRTKESVQKGRVRAIWVVAIFTLLTFIAGLFWSLGIPAGKEAFFVTGTTAIVSFILFTWLNDQLSDISRKRTDLANQKRLVKLQS